MASVGTLVDQDQPERRDDRHRGARPSPRVWFRDLGWRHVVGLAATAFAFFPVVWVLSAAFNPAGSLSSQQLIPADPGLDNFRTLIEGSPFWAWLLNSLYIGGTASVITVLLSALAAYAFSRMRFRGRRVGLLFLLLVQMFPLLLAVVALFLLFSALGEVFPFIGLGRREGLILIYLGGALGVNTWLMKGFFDTLPTDLDDAAAIDGASHVQIFLRIVLPLAAPILVVTGLLAFIAVFNDFLLASVILSGERNLTLAVGLQAFIATQYGARWGPFAAGAVIGGIAPIALFMYLQKYQVSSLTSGAVKG